MLTCYFLAISTDEGSTLWDCHVYFIDHDSFFSTFLDFVGVDFYSVFQGESKDVHNSSLKLFGRD